MLKVIADLDFMGNIREPETILLGVCRNISKLWLISPAFEELAPDNYAVCDKPCPFFQASCTGEVNQCRNGGTMIWDPVKQFVCLCKDGFGGERCEKVCQI